MMEIEELQQKIVALETELKKQTKINNFLKLVERSFDYSSNFIAKAKIRRSVELSNPDDMKALMQRQILSDALYLANKALFKDAKVTIPESDKEFVLKGIDREHNEVLLKGDKQQMFWIDVRKIKFVNQ